MTDQMYKPMPRSPMTTLYQGIDASQTTITVADASKLPDAPNKATIGGDDSETIKYTGKSGNDLTCWTRGFDPSGSAKAWDSATPVARIWTSQDLEVVQDNLDALDGHDNTLHSENYITDTQEHGNEKHDPDYIPATEKGANDGVATLDSGGDVPATQLGNVDAGGMEVHDNDYHNPWFATEVNLNNHVGQKAAFFDVHGLRGDKIAIGEDSSAAGVSSTALGRLASAVGDFSVALGVGASAAGNYSVALGLEADAEANYIVRIGDHNINSIGGYQDWSNVSDKRDKTDIESSEHGLNIITKLHPIKYRLDPRKRYEEKDDDGKITKHKKDGSRANEHYSYGFSAQELVEALKGTDLDIVDDADPNQLAVREGKLVPVLVKAVQELSEEVNLLKAKLQGEG